MTEIPIQKYPAGSNVQINLGSGQRPFGAEWINIDCQPKWHPDVVCSATDMSLVFDDGSAETIVLHHVFEHFPESERGAVIAECYRVLCPTGSLIVIVPDMKALARGWLAGRITDDVYFANVYGAYMGDEADRHKWGFTHKTLNRALLSAANWSYLTEYDFTPLPGADVAPKDWWFFGLEAIK